MATIRWPDLSLGVSGTQKIKKEGKWLEVLRKGAFEGKDRRTRGGGSASGLTGNFTYLFHFADLRIIRTDIHRRNNDLSGLLVPCRCEIECQVNPIKGQAQRKEIIKGLPKTRLGRQRKMSGQPRGCPDPVVAVHGEAARGAYQCDKPELDVTITKDQLLGWYKQMQTMRRMETAADGVLPLGYRAVSVSFEAGIMPDDRVITAYRYHSFAVLRSGTIKGIIGRQVGMSRQVPVGADIAFAQKYMDKDTATFALYGDGASNQGQVLEAYNMIAIVLHPSLELEPKPCKKKKKKRPAPWIPSRLSANTGSQLHPSAQISGCPPTTPARTKPTPQPAETISSTVAQRPKCHIQGRRNARF
ncbi:thiamine diphosphate-binding protein [Mycena galericulata]|nr:thiamine diphosphate-binding protein [Mycena galericulata]